MSKRSTTEMLLDGAAAAWLGLCLGIALTVAGPTLGIVKAAAIAPAWAAAAAWVTYRTLAGLRRPHIRLPTFDLQPVEPLADRIGDERSEELLLTPDMAVLTTELLLTRGQMLAPVCQQPAEPLLLVDVLAELRPGSRVVQLFDPARMPTAGELKSRIDRHLQGSGKGAPGVPPADASQALYDALADLRRSLA